MKCFFIETKIYKEIFNILSVNFVKKKIVYLQNRILNKSMSQVVRK